VASARKILCAGIAVQDIVMRVEMFPQPGAKRAAFAGPLGGDNDAVSERILADLDAEGVDCTGVARVDGGTASVSLILLDAAGEKTIATTAPRPRSNARRLAAPRVHHSAPTSMNS
jgi:sulfofructose kinase